MTKELQDLAWSVLPKEFKEEVKELAQYYCRHVSALFGLERQRADKFYREFVSLFGHHNLTSDAEGEVELLHVTRQKVMGLYANAKKLHDLYTSATCINEAESRTIDLTDGTIGVLANLFGSKCLPDEEPPLKITAAEDCIAMAKKEMDIKEEPKPAEPEEDIVENHNLSQHCDKSSDNPQADKTKAGTNHFGDNNEMVNDRRLHIAAMAMAGLLANPEVSCFTETQSLDHMDYITYYALEYADKLIKKTSNTN